MATQQSLDEWTDTRPDLDGLTVAQAVNRGLVEDAREAHAIIHGGEQ